MLQWFEGYADLVRDPDNVPKKNVSEVKGKHGENMENMFFFWDPLLRSTLISLSILPYSILAGAYQPLANLLTSTGILCSKTQGN